MHSIYALTEHLGELLVVVLERDVLWQAVIGANVGVGTVHQQELHQLHCSRAGRKEQRRLATSDLKN